MQIDFSPELEARLNRVAVDTGRIPEEVVKDLVAAQLEYDSWFRAEVKTGLKSLDSGRFVTHEDVAGRLAPLLKR